MLIYIMGITLGNFLYHNEVYAHDLMTAFICLVVMTPTA